MAWLIVIILIPYVGIPLYLIFSNRKFRTKLQKKEALFVPQKIGYSENPDTVERILDNMGSPAAKINEQVSLLSTGQEAYFELTRLIEAATKTIHLTTFIFADDQVGRALLNLLTKRASEGIRVRVLLDSLGSTWVRNPSFKELKKHGGQLGYFMPFLHMPFRGRYNLRNHRKILVVDSQKAILGGMNIAEEYMGPQASTSRWVDLGLKIQGPSAFDLEGIFSKDWKFATGEDIGLTSHSGATAGPAPSASTNHDSNRVQIVASGPDVKGDPLYDVLLTLIFKARARIWIASPYFIPDESLAKALQLAAQRGLDVRVLVPEKSNHPMADLARGSYLKQIQSSGCQIRFLPRMIHAKAFLVDEEYALVGSANFDMRSLLFNYEIGALISSKDEVAGLEKWFSSQFSQAQEKLPSSGLWIDLAEGIGRVLGPLI